MPYGKNLPFEVSSTIPTSTFFSGLLTILSGEKGEGGEGRKDIGKTS